jgi:hypothetical protein
MNKEMMQRIEDLVWKAWSDGALAGNWNTPERQQDRLHQGIYHEVQALLEDLSHLENE